MTGISVCFFFNETTGMKHGGIMPFLFILNILYCSVSLSTLNLAHRHILLLTEAEERAIELASCYPCCVVMCRNVRCAEKSNDVMYLRRVKSLKMCHFRGEMCRKL